MNQLIYLDTYILQKDMRLRLPKAILSNLDLEKGKSEFDIFYDKDSQSIVLKIHKEKQVSDLGDNING